MPTAIGGAMAHRLSMAAVHGQNPRALEAVKARPDELAPKVVILPATLDMGVSPNHVPSAAAYKSHRVHHIA